MNFMKYPTKNDISISNAVLKLAKLQNAERLELTAATGAVIVTSGRMTVKELLSTVQSLTGRAAELMTLLRLTCGDCTNCSEKCAYRDRSITELIRPAVVVPDWARQDAGLAGDAKLDCYVDEDTHELTVVEADYLQEEYFMKKFINKIAHTAKSAVTRVKTAAANSMSAVLAFNRRAVCGNAGEGYIDTAVKVLIAVVLGALVLAGLYAILNDTVMPTVTQKITEMFSYNAGSSQERKRVHLCALHQAAGGGTHPRTP